ncbi:MAG TPA: enoyl-CoA hydratase-related protein [Gaiellales bacterium]|nr:enoyl-CoA hydratase-related protein [Gaiellales bacterium]
MIEPLLYELHDMARARGIEGYRRMTKTELLELVGGGRAGGPTTVERSVRRGLGLLTLRGGTPENTLALETLEELASAVEELAADESVRLVAITGAGGRIFSAGADLSAVAGLPGVEVSGRGSAALDRIAAVDVPTVAVLNGHAVGGGIDLALACDWRLGAEGARLRFIHNELGYSPPWGAAERLGRLVPAPVALRLFATCALVSMQEAREMGLVDDLAAPHRLLGRVEALLTRIERADRVAVMATKRLLRPDTPREAHSAAFAALWDARSGEQSSTVQA